MVEQMVAPLETSIGAEAEGDQVGPSKTTSDTRTSDLLVWVLLLLAVFVNALDRGLTLVVADLRFDENLTAWITSGSFQDSLTRAWNHQGQSPLYFSALWIWQQAFGSDEVVLRIPSLIAFAATLWQLILLGRDLDRKRTGQIAAIFFASMNVGATEARPYIFMLLALIVGVRAGIRWAETGARRQGVIWAGCCAIAMYLQPFAAYAIIPHIAIAWVAVRRGRSRELAAFVVLGLVLLIPIIPQILSIRARHETLSIVELPTLGALLRGLLPVYVGLALATGVVVHRSVGSLLEPYESLHREVRWKLLVVGWMVMPALALFVQSYATNNGVFVGRWYATAIPGLCLAAGALLSRLSARGIVAGSLTSIVVAALVLFPWWSHDWYSAVDSIERADAQTEVWTVTGYVESDHAVYFEDDSNNDYLNGSLIWHGAERELLSIPRIARDGGTTDVHDENIARAIANGQTILLIEWVPNSNFRLSGPQYVEDSLVSAGYGVSERESADYVSMTTLTPER